MFDGLKRKYIDWKIKSTYSKKNQREKRFMNWSEAKRIVLLVSYETPNCIELDQLMKKLSDKEVSAWCYITTHDFVRKDSENILFFNDKSTNWLSKPNHIIEGKFISESYDVLIDLTMSENLSMKYLAGISKAHCKCGKKKEGYSLYDLEISSDQTMDRMELLQQILHYLSTIKSKN